MESDKKAQIKEILEKYRKAGQISIEAKKIAKKIIKPGVNAFEAAEKVEDYIRSQGAKPAFPINISIDNEAAHYSPVILDDRVIPENSIVKVDLGAQIDGYIVDTAITLNFNDKLELLDQAAHDALEAAISVAKAGTKLVEIGKVVEKTITSLGFEPVRNLSGHQIKRNILHAGVSIPNTGSGFHDNKLIKLQAGRIYAIEPFASTGRGLIKNGPHTNIFRFIDTPTRKQTELIPIYKKYKEIVGVLPFSPRHLYQGGNGDSKEEVTMNLRKLLRKNIIMGYPVLIEEKSKGMVSQYEHTLRITKSGCEVLTSNEHN